MEKEAGPPSVPGPARLWVELQATVNKVRCKFMMCVSQRYPNRKPGSRLSCVSCAPGSSWELCVYCPFGGSSPRATETQAES